MKLTYKNIEFEVKIKNSNVSKKWEELTKNNPISKVSAYGYGEINKVVDKLNETIKGLKKYNLPEIENVDNQQLDYLHDKFLEFHDNSKGEERKLFSDLNEYIHKAESLLVVRIRLLLFKWKIINMNFLKILITKILHL